MKKGHLKMPAPTAMSVDDQGHPLNDSASSVGIQGTNTTATVTPQINPMTGAFFTAAELDEEHTAGADMTEEEKAEENSRLIDAFERLNRTGIVRVGVPSDLLAERERMRGEQLDQSGAGDVPSKK